MLARFSKSTCAALAFAALLSACGAASDNGVAAKSPDEIVSAASDAVVGVKSVHVAGSLHSGGTVLTLNLDLVSGKGGRGSIAENGLSFKLVELGHEVYINASPAFWRHFAGNATAQLFKGKWLKAPAGGQFASIGELTDPRTFFQKLFSSHGKLAKSGKRTVDGRSVIGVRDTTNGGILYVAAAGKPYPIELVKSGSQGGHIDFTRFNESVSLTAPRNSIDLSQLG